MVKEKRLKFIGYGSEVVTYKIYNKKENYLGDIEKRRVGSYMHWCLCPGEDLFFSPGCIDEIREFMRNPEKYLESFPECRVDVEMNEAEEYYLEVSGIYRKFRKGSLGYTLWLNIKYKKQEEVRDN